MRVEPSRGDESPCKKRQVTHGYFLYRWGHSEKVTICKLDRGLSHQNPTLIWDFSACRTVRSNFCCLSALPLPTPTAPVPGLWLKQPELREACSQRINRTAIWPSNSMACCIPKIKENKCPHSSLYTNAESSIIYNSPQMEKNLSVH